MNKCCVLIPYFNDGESLLESIGSIDGTPDVIVVDDGSREPAVKVLEGYSDHLTVKLIVLPKNQGIEHALNAGLEYCLDNYEYVARLDCGDTCKNKRIQKQIEFLDKEKDYGLVGSWVDFVSEDGDYILTSKLPVEHNEIRKKMFLNSMFVHPSVMMRSFVLKEVGLYPTDRPAAEDYALFFKVTKKYKTRNIPEPLLNYVISSTSISSKKRSMQIKSRIKVIIDNFEPGIYPIYGILRSMLLMATPRALTVTLRKIKSTY